MSSFALLLVVFAGGLGFASSQSNSAPSITIKSRYFAVPENTEVGTVIYQLTATDLDDDDLTFEPSTVDTSKTVDITPAVKNGTTWASNITLKARLDRDNGLSKIDLYFNVADSKYKVGVTLSMIITDVNDNPPTLTGLPYRTSVPEDQPVGVSLYQFSATDPDTGRGSSVLYFMSASNAADEEDYTETFHLNNQTGNVTLLKNIDYETRSFYHFKVFAKDEGTPPCPSPQCLCGNNSDCAGIPVDFFITVVDVEDTPPVFERLPYVATVSEIQHINYTILTAKATDGDRGVANPSPIVYSLSDATVPFSVNSLGQIKVSKPLDADGDLRQGDGFYLFNITAIESTTNQNTSTLVSISIADANDNPPLFNHNNFTASVLENTPKGVPLTVTTAIQVQDKDQGLNSRLRVSVRTMAGDPELDFSTIPGPKRILQGSSSITITVNNSMALDFEKTKEITFELLAQEVVGTGHAQRLGNQSHTAWVKVIVKDRNDNSPVFQDVLNSSNVYTVPENAAIMIHTFNATDQDSEEFGKVVFSLEDGSSDSKFSMTPDGNLTLMKGLDREKQDTYYLVITATDNPDAPFSQQRRTQLRVTVLVTDVNDEAPVWTEPSTIFSVPETEKLEVVVATLRATDGDIGVNKELEYRVDASTNGSAYFDARNNSDGQAELYIKASPKGFPGLYNVVVIATDKGDPPQQSTLQVQVLVADINLDPPVFIQPNMTKYNVSSGNIPQIEVLEEQEEGTVLYTLQATDEGTGPNDRVYYYLLPSTNNDYKHVKVDPTSGNISVAQKMDREEKEVLEIQVRAEDRGLPAPLSTTISMRIKILDKDDNSPTYGKGGASMVMKVLEEKMNASIGTVMKATDKDLVDNICYYLCDKQGMLHLDKHNGSLSLLGKVNREQQDHFDVQVLASSTCDDNNGTHQPPTNCTSAPDSVLRIRVDVLDIDDNPPRFSPKAFSRSLPYDKQINYQIINLKDNVIDEDAFPHNNHKFRLSGKVSLSPDMARSFNSGLDPNKLFNVSDGSIRTSVLFQANLVGYFSLKVQVYETTNVHFNDVATIKIYIVANEQRVRLVFSKLPDQVNSIIDKLTRDLSRILNLKITAGAIKTHTKSDGSRDVTKTDAFIYASEKNSDGFLTATELQKALDFNQNARDLLLGSGVQKAQGLSVTEDDDGDETLRRLFVILVTVMSIVVVALILVLIKIIRMYRRRLKAATTMAYVSPKQQEMYEHHPGTNKYYADSNPLFGKEIKAPEVEDDRNSQNSLDVNAVDPKTSPKTAYDNAAYENHQEEQEVVLQIMDTSLSSPPLPLNGHAPANRNSRLNKVLEEYDSSLYNNNNNKSNSKTKAFPPPPPPNNMVEMNGVGHNNNYNSYNNNNSNNNVNSSSQVKGHHIIIPGLGQDVQEGVTRFSDDSGSGSRAKRHGVPETIHEISSHHGDLEYTEI